MPRPVQREVQDRIDGMPGLREAAGRAQVYASAAIGAIGKGGFWLPNSDDYRFAAGMLRNAEREFVNAMRYHSWQALLPLRGRFVQVHNDREMVALKRADACVEYARRFENPDLTVDEARRMATVLRLELQDTSQMIRLDVPTRS